MQSRSLGTEWSRGGDHTGARRMFRSCLRSKRDNKQWRAFRRTHSAWLFARCLFSHSSTRGWLAIFQNTSAGNAWAHMDSAQTALAHPLDNGSAACLFKDVGVTAEQLREDLGAYRRLMKPLAQNWENLSIEFLQPMLHWPQHPITLAHFGILALCPATFLAKFIFKGEPARALFAGIAAHSFLPLEAPVSSAFALVLQLAGYAVGWPSRAADRSRFRTRLPVICVIFGGKIESIIPVENLRDVPKSRAILLDLSVWEICVSQVDKCHRAIAADWNHFGMRLEFSKSIMR